ncbi:MAG TPA: dTDP-4-dehydrorhamnose 3,5-epimerase [Vicinamibacteria bacterium]|nr:dTDP-4-dehydrorhamnose 3,5-epimerase [Vicinamibacteria bacterium]
MNTRATELPGLLVIEPRVHGDSRGYFSETWHQDRYRQAGLPHAFVQDNISFSGHGVLRGLHFQNPRPQGKLVYVLLGEIFDVAVDVRVGSPTFGRWTGVTLSDQNRHQLFVPEGFAHGVCVTSPTALVAYKCTGFYAPDCERTLLWDDPEVGVDWPIRSPIVSAKDGAGLTLRGLAEQRMLPSFAAAV